MFKRLIQQLKRWSAAAILILLTAKVIISLSGCYTPILTYALPENRWQVINIIKSKSIEIPMTIGEEHNLPSIECTINGQKARLMLDTGANTMGIFKNKIDKFGIKIIGRKDAYTPEGKKSFDIGNKMIVSIGGEVHLEVQNISILHGLPDDNNVDGILCATLMKVLQSHIDFKSDILKINLTIKHNKKNAPDKK
ncbi:aspartyl protease family protein [Verrucomicrobiota bacterium]